MMMMMGSRGSGGGGGGGGGCCVARYDAAAAKMDRIMLKFRPIAPKPTSTGGSSSGGSSPGNNSNGETYRKIGRGKRRYQNNKNRGPRNGRKRRKATSPEVVTLPLLPETPGKDLKRSAANAPIWLNFNSGTAEKDEDRNNIDNVTSFGSSHRQICYGLDRTVVVPPRVVGGTCVTLECLTYTMVDVDALGRSDEEQVMNLESDTCPGFVSDRLSRVSWSNAAFNKLVGEDSGLGRVWVAMKETVPAGARAFSCRVRVQTGDGRVGAKRRTMTVPCDVWRMDCGGFAWRLDVKAALSLGLC